MHRPKIPTSICVCIVSHTVVLRVCPFHIDIQYLYRFHLPSISRSSRIQPHAHTHTHISTLPKWMADPIYLHVRSSVAFMVNYFKRFRPKPLHISGFINVVLRAKTFIFTCIQPPGSIKPIQKVRRRRCHRRRCHRSRSHRHRWL